MKILLVFIHVADSRLDFPLGGGLLKSAIYEIPELSSWKVKILNFSAAQSAKEIIDSIKNEKAEGIGFSLFTWNLTIGLETAEAIRSFHPGILLFAGGPQTSADPFYLWEKNVFNFLVIGEGEISLPMALKEWGAKKEIKQIRGIFTGDRLTRSPAVDPNAFPSPFISGNIIPGDYNSLLWEMSRGCPYHCAFCYESRGEKTIRTINIKRLAAELDIFISQGVEDVWVLDPTFNQDKQRAVELLTLLIEKECFIHFTFEIRAEKLDAHLADLFGQLNCSLQIGLQSIHPSVLKKLNRTINPDLFKEKCALLSERDINYGLDLIYGLPGDNYEGFRSSLDWALSLQPANLDIFPLAVLPGTDLALKADSFGIKHKGAPDYLITQVPGFSIEDMVRAEKLTNSCDELYNKEEAASWFPIILKTLKLKASEVLEKYSIFSHSITGDKKTPSPLLDFFEKLFKEQKALSLYPPIKNFIEYSRALPRLFEEGSLCLTLLYSPEELDNLTCIDRIEQFQTWYGEGREATYTLTLSDDGFLWEEM